MSSLGIDYGRLEEARRRLAKADTLVGTIIDAARELDALVADPDDPVAYALDVAAHINGNGASPPQAPAAELDAGPPPSSAAPASSATLDRAGVGFPKESGQTQPGPAPAPRRASRSAVGAEGPSQIDPGADDPEDSDGDDGGIRIDPGAGPERAAERNGVLERRIKAHLLDEASTISELALALDVPRRDVAPVVLALVEDDPDVVRVEGATRGRGFAETIYSNIA